MFKCLDTTTNQPVISLDKHDPSLQEELRRKSHADKLGCPTCKEAVAFKAGKVKRSHFAHKTLANCPTQNESSDLLEARAVLYEWLQSKFFENVTLEQHIDNAKLSRPFDCWVNHKSNALAYWIVEKKLPSEIYESIVNAVSEVKAHLVWIFMAKALRRLGQNNKLIKLSTTERKCLTGSEFDTIYQIGSNGTLHYLDADAKMLTTFRACECFHSPQVYSGHEVQTPLNNLLVSPKTGEFVHPLEHGRLAEYQQKLQQKRALEQKLEEERKQQDEVRQQLISKRSVLPVYSFPKRKEPIVPDATLPSNASCICEDCGTETFDWAIKKPDGSGLCGNCSRKREESRMPNNT